MIYMVIRKFVVCFVLFLFLGTGFVLAVDEKDFGVDSALLKMVVREGELVNKSFNVVGYRGGDFSIDTNGMDFIGVDKIFNLNSGEEKSIDLTFNSSGLRPGIYFGRITISNGNFVEIPVIFEIESSEVLFDGSISVPIEYSKVYSGGSLIIENKIFNLENIGLKTIDAHYFVEDFNGNSLFSEDENLAVETQTLNTKSISISEDVLPGDYLLGVVLKYGNSVGTSSYFFRVSEEESFVSDEPRENYFLWAVILLLISLIFFIIYYLRQRDQVFLELNRQYRREVNKQKSVNLKPREIKNRLVVVKKIYRDRIKVVKNLRKQKKKKKVEDKLAEWRKQGYNVDEFFGEGKKNESLIGRVKKFKKQGYHL